MILTLKPMAKIAFSGFLPPYGISILVMVPFDYLETRKTAKIIDRSFEVGDQVQRMIRAGSIEDKVRGYLSGRKRRVRVHIYSGIELTRSTKKVLFFFPMNRLLCIVD